LQIQTHAWWLAISLIASSSVSCAKPACNESASLSTKSYSRAVAQVTRLPETQAWQRTHAYPVTLGVPMDRQVQIGKACFWEVSVYANRPERLELWNTFLVPIKGQVLLIRDSEGKAIPLKQWKTRVKPQP
jgi:hypothetical protein